MVYLFNFFVFDCNVLYLNVILVYVFVFLILLYYFLGGICILIIVYGVFIMLKIDLKYGWGKIIGYLNENNF